MPTKTLSYYCSKFENLRRDFKNGGAPHKPILLISLIQAYQNGLYTTSEIQVLLELVELFKSNRKSLVQTDSSCKTITGGSISIERQPFSFTNAETRQLKFVHFIVSSEHA